MDSFSLTDEGLGDQRKGFLLGTEFQLCFVCPVGEQDPCPQLGEVSRKDWPVSRLWEVACLGKHGTYPLCLTPSCRAGSAFLKLSYLP